MTSHVFIQIPAKNVWAFVVKDCVPFVLQNGIMSSPPTPTDDVDQENENLDGEEEGSDEVEAEENLGSEEEDEEEGEDEEGEDEDEEEGEEKENSTEQAVILNYDTLMDLPSKITPKQLRRVMETQVEKLKAMTPAQMIANMPDIERLHKQCYAAAERFIKEVISQIPEYSPVIKEVGEYNQKACDKLMETTMEDFKQNNKSLEGESLNYLQLIQLAWTSH